MSWPEGCRDKVLALLVTWPERLRYSNCHQVHLYKAFLRRSDADIELSMQMQDRHPIPNPACFSGQCSLEQHRRLGRSWYLASTLQVLGIVLSAAATLEFAVYQLMHQAVSLVQISCMRLGGEGWQLSMCS